MTGVKRQSYAAVIAAIFVMAVMWFWAATASVVWFERGIVISAAPTSVQMEVVAYKVRDCRFVPGSPVGYVKTENGRWHESRFQFVNDLTPNSSKPKAWFRRLSFGVWQWDAETGPIVATMLTVGHDCGNPDRPNSTEFRTTTLGPFPI